jgi:hypothetical protein
MQRLTSIFKLLTFLILFAYSCKPAELPPAEEVEEEIVENKAYLDTEANFIHSVFFWMKEDATEEDKAAMVKAMEELSKVESISRVYFGPPADTAERDVVDNTYSFAFIVHFKDKAAHDAYQVDPIHLDFIEKNKHYWTKVQVYDNIIQARY